MTQTYLVWNSSGLCPPVSLATVFHLSDARQEYSVRSSVSCIRLIRPTFLVELPAPGQRASITVASQPSLRNSTARAVPAIPAPTMTLRTGGQLGEADRPR